MNSRNNSGKIVVVIVSAVLIVIMGILLTNSAKNYVRVNMDIAAENLALEQDQQKLDELVKLSKQDKEMTALIEQSKKLMPGEPEEDELITYIQDTAYEAETEFVQIRFGTRIQGKSYMEMPINISFTGDYTSLMDFLTKIRNGERAIRVDTLSVKPVGTDASKISAELTASAFYTGSSDNTTSTTASNADTANTSK